MSRSCRNGVSGAFAYNLTSMGITALQAQGEGLGAAGVGEYRGATTVARFGDPEAEFWALRKGCGAYDLGFRAKISLTGGDRVRWLNGMVTNNIRDLASGQGVYAFLLNPQGHILGDLFAYNRGESITVDTDRSQIEKILATFDHYIIMDDVEVTNLSEQLTALGVGGPKSREVLAAAGISIPDMQALQMKSFQWRGAECTVVRDEDENIGYEIWISPDRRAATLGCVGDGRRNRGRFRGTGAASGSVGRPAVWGRHSGARLAAGD